MLAETRISLPASRKGSERRWIRRSARLVTSARLSFCAHSTANSSPPSRTGRSPRPHSLVIRRAAAISRSSPVSWPSVSFTTLNLSRSMNIKVRPAPGRETDLARFSLKRRRLARPVSVSLRAMRESRCSAMTSTVTSLITPRMDPSVSGLAETDHQVFLPLPASGTTWLRKDCCASIISASSVRSGPRENRSSNAVRFSSSAGRPAASANRSVMSTRRPAGLVSNSQSEPDASYSCNSRRTVCSDRSSSDCSIKRSR